MKKKSDDTSLSRSELLRLETKISEEYQQEKDAVDAKYKSRLADIKAALRVLSFTAETEKKDTIKTSRKGPPSMRAVIDSVLQNLNGDTFSIQDVMQGIEKKTGKLPKITSVAPHLTKLKASGKIEVVQKGSGPNPSTLRVNHG